MDSQIQDSNLEHLEENTQSTDNQTNVDEGTNNSTDYEKRYKDLQAEYTKLKQGTKTEETQTLDEEKQALIDEMKALGLMTREDYEKEEASKSQLQKLDSILEDRPELGGLKEAIKTMQEKTGEDWDTVIKNNFDSVISSSPTGSIVGDRNIPSRNVEKVDITSMNKSEFDEFKRKAGIGNSFKR